jgi:hypothetical protein
MNYFYHNSIRNYTIALLDLFNDIHIPRYDKNGDRIQDITVPIKFGTREKGYILSSQDYENLHNGNVNVLPKMILEFNSLSKAQDRNTNKNSRINKRTPAVEQVLKEYQYNAVAYDFEFTLHFATKTFTDCTIIIEQIAPMFRPDISIKIQELDIQEEPTTVPVAIGDFDIEIPDLEHGEIRIIEGSLPITLKGNLYLPIKDQGVIRDIEVNMINVTTDRNIKAEEYSLDAQTDIPEIEVQASQFKITSTEDQTKDDIDINKIDNPGVVI